MNEAVQEDFSESLLNSACILNTLRFVLINYKTLFELADTLPVNNQSCQVKQPQLHQNGSFKNEASPLNRLNTEQAIMVLNFPYCSQAVTTALAQVDREKIYQWINELSSPETRENALLELSKKRESVPDLAPMLWHSCGTIAALLQVSRRFTTGLTLHVVESHHGLDTCC